MTVVATAKRRRKQAVNNYRHMPKQRRPVFRTRNKETSEKREARARERAIMMMHRKRKR